MSDRELPNKTIPWSLGASSQLSLHRSHRYLLWNEDDYKIYLDLDFQLVLIFLTFHLKWHFDRGLCGRALPLPRPVCFHSHGRSRCSRLAEGWVSSSGINIDFSASSQEDFNRHYLTNKAPYTLAMHTNWFQEENQVLICHFLRIFSLITLLFSEGCSQWVFGLAGREGRCLLCDRNSGWSLQMPLITISFTIKWGLKHTISFQALLWMTDPKPLSQIK